MDVVHPSDAPYEHLDRILPIFTKILFGFKHKSVYYYSIISLISVAAFTVVLMVFIFTESTREFWFSYGMILLILIPIMLQLCFALLGFKKWKNLRASYGAKLPWNFAYLSFEQRQRITKFCRRTDLICVALLLDAELCCLIDQIQVHPALMNLCRRFIKGPVAAHFVATHIALAVQYMQTFVMLVPYSTLYLVVLARIQLTVLLFMVRDFRSNAALLKVDQSDVVKGLKHLICRHQTILKVISQVREWYFWSIIFSGVSIVVLSGFYALMLFSPFFNYKSTLFVYVLSVCTIYYFCYEGQAFEDLGVKISDELYNFNWYDWNRDTMEIFTPFIFNSCEPVNINSVDFLKVNHEFFKQCLAIVYALLNLVAAVALKNGYSISAIQ